MNIFITGVILAMGLYFLAIFHKQIFFYIKEHKMLKSLRNFFKKEKAKVISFPLHAVKNETKNELEKEEFENVEKFLNKSADLNIETVQDSKSTIFFKDELANSNNEKELAAFQSTLIEEEEIEQNKYTAIVPEEEFMIQS